MSIRDASLRGGISNTTWSKWENGEIKLGKAMRRAVSTTFGWPDDWPENPPLGELTDVEALNAKLDRLIQLLIRAFGDERSHEQ